MSKIVLRIPVDQAEEGGIMPVRLFWWVCHRCGAISPTRDPKFPRPEGWVSTVVDQAGLPEVVLCDECANRRGQ